MESTRDCRATHIWSAVAARIVDELGARVRLVRRRYSSYTPIRRQRATTGLLIGPHSTFGAVGLGRRGGVRRVLPSLRHRHGSAVPTLLHPLCTRDEARKHVGDEAAWRFIVDEPIGMRLQTRCPTIWFAA